MNELNIKASARRILDYLTAHGSITGHDALVFCGTMDLRARISDLRKAGVPIRAEWETSDNQFGEAVRYKRYWLVMGEEVGA